MFLSTSNGSKLHVGQIQSYGLNKTIVPVRGPPNIPTEKQIKKYQESVTRTKENIDLCVCVTNS